MPPNRGGIGLGDSSSNTTSYCTISSTTIEYNNASHARREVCIWAQVSTVENSGRATGLQPGKMEQGAGLAAERISREKQSSI